MQMMMYTTLLLWACCLGTNAYLFPKPLCPRPWGSTKIQRQRKQRKQQLASRAFVASSAVALGIASTLGRQPFSFTPAPDSLRDQTILLTGGTTGLGLESAQRLALGGASVILTARSDRKGEAAVQKIQSYLARKGVTNDRISYRLLDLDNLENVKQAMDWQLGNTKIDVLLNNAGIMALPQREITVDGYEKQMQSNHLGHFVLTAALSDKLAKDARIINVSSTAHTIPGEKGLDFEYMWTGSPNYQPWKSYGQSKLANILFTQELQRRSDEAGKEWSVVTLHPGVVSTDLGRYLFGNNNNNNNSNNNALLQGVSRIASSFLKTPEQGASTQIMLAARAEMEETGANGKYFVDGKARPLHSFALDRAAARRLWEESEAKANIKFDIFNPIMNAASSAVREVSVVTEKQVEEEETLVSDEPSEESDASLDKDINVSTNDETSDTTAVVVDAGIEDDKDTSSDDTPDTESTSTVAQEDEESDQDKDTDMDREPEKE